MLIVLGFMEVLFKHIKIYAEGKDVFVARTLLIGVVIMIVSFGFLVVHFRYGEKKLG